MVATDRRAFNRVPYFTEAWLEGLDVARVLCRIADLSVGGVFVDARTALPAGTHVNLRFRLPDREIDTLVEVRYSVPGIGMGLRFLNLSQPDRATIEAFVSSRV